MNEIRIRVQCTKDEDHAKVLRLDASLGMEYARGLAGLLDGTSPMYIYPPGDGSPIGKCAICGAQLECSVFEIVEQAPDVSEGLRDSLKES